MTKKKGWIKFADPDLGYGYIIAEDADSPKHTTLFDLKDIVETEAGPVRPGCEVEFDEEFDERQRKHAKDIRVTRTV